MKFPGPSSFVGKKKDAIFLSGANLMNYALSMLAGIVAAGILGPEQYATKVLVFSIVGLVASFSDLGISFAVMKDGGGKGGSRTFSSGLWLSIISGAVFFVLLFPAFVLVGRGYGISEPFLFAIYAGTGLLKQISSIGYSYLVSRERAGVAASLNAVAGISYLILVLALTWALGLFGFFLAVFLSSLLDASLKLFWAFRELGRAPIAFSGFGPIEKSIVTTGLASTGMSLLSYVALNSSKFALGLLSDRAIVAYFAIALLPIYPIIVVSGSIASSIVPRVRRARGNERMRLVGKSLRYSALAGFGIASIAVPGYWILTNAFLPKYSPSLALLAFLAVPIAIEGGISSISATFLLAMGRNREALFARAVGVIPILVLGPILTLQFGVWGTIAAFWAGSLLGGVLLLRTVLKN